MTDLASLARQAVGGRARVLLAGLVLAGLALITYSHSVHLIPVLPYLLLLACPLMHLFMPHGHGGASHHSGGGDASQLPSSDEKPHDA